MRRTFHRIIPSVGLYLLLLELSGCQTFSGGGGKLPPFAHQTNEALPIKQSPHSLLIGGKDGVYNLPQIHSPQTKLAVQVGDRVQLPCKVHDLGQNQVLWKHGTNILAGSNVSTFADPRIDMMGDFSLTIAQAERLDEGDYTCIVTSLPSLSITHSLLVFDAPTVSLLTPTNLIVTEGDSLEIGCIPHGHPLPKVSWSMRDGIMPLLLHPHLNQPRLPLENVTRAYTGLYVCTADNGVGRPAIGAVYVRVLYSPEIEIPRFRVHGGFGFQSQLVGLVHGDPKPDVRWKLGNEVISNSTRVFSNVHGRNEYRLIFNPAKPSDFAMYSLEANNSLGFDLKNIEFLGVPGVPVLTHWETEDANGLQVTLHWRVECYSSLVEYKLYFRQVNLSRNEDEGLSEEDPGLIKLQIPADKFNDHAVTFLHTKSFTLRGLNDSAIYQAAVQARNRFGWSLPSSVCYFATFPNSSIHEAKEMEEALSKMKSAYRFQEERRAWGKDFERASASRAEILCAQQLQLSLFILMTALWTPAAGLDGYLYSLFFMDRDF